MQSQLTQQGSQVTTPSTVARRVASTICRFLGSPDAPEAQTQNLIIVTKLWSVVKDVFTPCWLSGPAEIVVAAVLKRKFTLTDDGVKLAWSSLCADLISAGIPSLPHVLSVQSGRREEKEVKRRLWTMLAKSYLASESQIPWEDLTSSLIIPLGYPVYFRNLTGN